MATTKKTTAKKSAAPAADDGYTANGISVKGKGAKAIKNLLAELADVLNDGDRRASMRIRRQLRKLGWNGGITARVTSGPPVKSPSAAV